MSYDLYFITKNDECKLTKADFIEYFANRPRYQAAENQTWYSNEDTGVYFSFEYQDERSFDAEEFDYVAAFNINYNRPHIFGLEAEPEVKSIIDHFKLDISDPQMNGNGMGEGPYSRAGFLQGWNEGNLFGITAMMSHDDINVSNHDLLTLPYAEIERYWKWNFNRDKLQEQMEADVFVPRIMFCREQNEVKSFVIWPDAIPMVLPKVDKVILYKNELAPRRFFSKQPVTCLVDHEAAQSFFPSQQLCTEEGLSYRQLFHDQPPQNILEFFVKQKPVTIQGVAPDSIFDAELVDQAKETTPSMKTIGGSK